MTSEPEPDVLGSIARLIPDFSQLQMLMALQHKPHVYGGTVPPEIVAERRARNRRARAARRVTRARSG